MIALLGSAAVMSNCVASEIRQFLLFAPAEAETLEGDDLSYEPFQARGNARWQQVYDDRLFSAVPEQGAFINSIGFRTDCFRLRGTGTVHTNVVVSLSTTTRSADALSPVFAENFGSDGRVVEGPRTVVLGGQLHSQTVTCDGSPWPLEINNWVSFDRAFFYRPAQGSLLLDIQAYDVSTPGDGYALDAVNDAGDGISRVYGMLPSGSGEVLVADAVDTKGLFTIFSFLHIPSITQELTPQGLKLTWDSQPPGFELQWASELSLNVNWNGNTGVIERNFVSSTTSIPYAELGARRFFRLRYDN